MQSEAKALVATLKASFPRQEFDQSNFDAYVHGLLDLDAGLAGKAVETVCQGATFFPSIGEIRDVAARLKLQAPSPSAAFAQALAPGARHELVQRARRLVGTDWDWRNEEARWLRKPFMEAYLEVLQVATMEIAQPALAVGAFPALEAVTEVRQIGPAEAPTEVIEMPAAERERLAAMIGWPMP